MEMSQTPKARRSSSRSIKLTAKALDLLALGSNAANEDSRQHDQESPLDSEPGAENGLPASSSNSASGRSATAASSSEKTPPPQPIRVTKAKKRSRRITSPRTWPCPTCGQPNRHQIIDYDDKAQTWKPVNLESHPSRRYILNLTREGFSRVGVCYMDSCLRAELCRPTDCECIRQKREEQCFLLKAKLEMLARRNSATLPELEGEEGAMSEYDKIVAAKDMTQSMLGLGRGDRLHLLQDFGDECWSAACKMLHQQDWVARCQEDPKLEIEALKPTEKMREVLHSLRVDQDGLKPKQRKAVLNRPMVSEFQMAHDMDAMGIDMPS